jgi:putative transposase
MLVEMPTDHKAAKVAEVTGWALVPSKADPEKPSRRLGAADGFEEHRAAVEAVSVLFKLYDTAADGSLAQVPSGWTVTAAKFEVEWPEDPSVVRSHFGARRFAYNWARGRVIADIETMGHDPGHEPVAWNLAALRKEWNRLKDQVAPWWAENSKEAYSGLSACRPRVIRPQDLVA